MNSKNKIKNILIFFLKMIFFFFLFDILLNIFSPLFVNITNEGKYGEHLIAEIGAVLLVLIVLILSKNTNIFSTKKESFFKAIKVGGFMLCMSIFILIVNLSTLKSSIKFYDLLSLVIFCFLIGLFEELLCRGWIQNEFLKKFPKNRRQVFLSIILSSLIFGGMHISNIWIGGQEVLETIVQIIQATGLGILLGSVYFRTKNIWSSIFLHSFWDFAVFLGQINIIKDCTTIDYSFKYSFYMLISSIILTAIYTLVSIYILRKSKTNHLIEEYSDEEIKKSDVNKMRLICAIIILYVALGQIPVQENNEVCYEYETKNIIYNEITYPQYNKYTIKELNLQIFLNSENELIFKDLITNKESKFNKHYVVNFIVINNDNTYTLLIKTLNDYENDTLLYLANIDIYNKKDNYISNIISSLKELTTAPTTKRLGYLISLNDNIKYPFIETTLKDTLILIDNEFYILKKEEYQENNDFIDSSNDNIEDNIN